MVKYWWMAVTADEYELPLVVTESCKKLAQILGIKADTMAHRERQNLSGKMIGYRVVKVRRDEQ